MVERIFTLKKSTLLLLSLILLTSQVCLSTTLVNFQLQSGNSVAAGYSSGNGNCKFYASTTTGTIAYNSNTGANIAGWNTLGGYWYTSGIDASAFYNLTLTAQMNSESNSPTFGPRDFKLQYSINGGSTWIDVIQLPILNSTLTGLSNITLPPNCNYQSDVRVRFITTSTYNINNATTTPQAAKSYIKGLVISGNQLLPPTTQSSNISVIAMTPVSISLDCSMGGGTDRIIVMSTSSSFTNPTNDYTPSSISTDYISGEQVIYDGSGTSVTVNVPSSKNQYYFRIYDYNLNSGKKRYNINTDVDNPKSCKLENVILPSVKNIMLTSATLGGTITSPASGTISDRGIYWSTSAGVTVFSNQIPEGGTDVGAFTFNVTGLPRGTTNIYFKAYVNNLSGTALSEEMSFPNIPIFTGTGNWENPSLWNVKEIPGSVGSTLYGSNGDAADSPVINGNCKQTVSNSVTDLTINSGKCLTISPAACMNVMGTLTNNASTSGLVIESSSSLPNGSLIYANGSPSATVEMYSKAKWTAGNSKNDIYKWQYFGIPVKTLNYDNSFSNCYVREWDETVNDYNLLWVQQNNGNSLTLGSGSTLSSTKGYELCQGSPKIYSFSGVLENGDFSIDLPYTANAVYPGQHIIGNPYTAAINISKMTFGANTEASVYLYNAGTYTDWLTSNGEITPGSGPGTYSVSTPGTAGYNAVPGQISSMQAFLVKATGGTGNINLSYNTLVATNSEQQRIKKADVQISQSISTRIDVIGTHFSDRMWIFTNPTCTRKFDNGFDGRKMPGSSQVTQLYSSETDGHYQINAVSDMNESYLGFQPGDDSSFKLVFHHENIEKKYAGIYLVDLVENKTVDVTANGTEYAFNTSSGTAASQRFKIVTSPIESKATEGTNKQLKMFSSAKAVFVENFSGKTGNFVLYNLAGKAVQLFTIDSNGLTTIPTFGLSYGAYVAKVITDSEEVTQRLIIR